MMMSWQIANLVLKEIAKKYQSNITILPYTTKFVIYIYTKNISWVYEAHICIYIYISITNYSLHNIIPQNLNSTLRKFMTIFSLLFFFLIHIVEAEVIPNLSENLVLDNNGETTSIWWRNSTSWTNGFSVLRGGEPE